MAKGDPGKGLTDKQRRFVEEYVVDLNATAAGERAGYARKRSGTFTALMSLPHVKAAVERALEEKRAASKITAERLLEALGRVAFANIADYVRVGRDGSPQIDFSRLSRDQAFGIARLTVEYFDDPEGLELRRALPEGGMAPGAERRVRRVHVGLGDRGAAMREISKVLGFYWRKPEPRSAEAEGPVRLVVNTGVPRTAGSRYAPFDESSG